MTKLATGRKRNLSKPTDLSGQAHEQIIELLRLGDASQNPAIARAAVRLAEKRQIQLQRQEAKLSPATASILATVVGLAAVSACWFALVSYPGQIGLELVWIISSIAIFLICLYALFSGYLSQANFMTVFKWVGSRFKQLSPFPKRKGPSFVGKDDKFLSDDDEFS